MFRRWQQLVRLVFGKPIQSPLDRLEAAVALLLAGLLFLLISLLVVGRSVGAALFLAHFDASGLAILYILVGATVAAMVMLLGKADPGEFHPMASLGLLLILQAGVFLAAAFLTPGNTNGSSGLLALAYLLMESLAFLITIQFWAMTNALLSVEQASRLYTGIGTGGIFGSMAGGLAAHQLLGPSLGDVFLGLAWLLPLELALLAVAWRLARRLANACPKNEWDWNLQHAPETLVSQKHPSERLLRRVRRRWSARPLSPSAKLVTAFGIVSLLAVFTTTLVDCYFKLLAHQCFQGDTQGLASFFGGFYFCVGLATFAAQLLLTPRFLRTGAPFAGLVSMPGTLILLAMLNFVLPGLGFAALFKLVDSVFAHSVYRSCQEVLYTPLPVRWVRPLKHRTEGIFGRSGLILAGLFILGVAPFWRIGGPAALLGPILIALLAWTASVMHLWWRYRRDSRKGYLRHAAGMAATPLTSLTIPVNEDTSSIKTAVPPREAA